MKRNQHSLLKYAWLVSGLVLAAILPLVLTRFKSSFHVRERDVGNNPDHFHLWTTNSTYSYTFIYDPLAADIWLFESGGFERNPEFVQSPPTPR
jgi:hypothetical protein